MAGGGWRRCDERGSEYLKLLMDMDLGFLMRFLTSKGHSYDRRGFFVTMTWWRMVICARIANVCRIVCITRAYAVER
jgi:hypothetical protein